MNENEILNHHRLTVANLLRKIDMPAITRAIDALYAAWQDGKMVMFCGNGGSGASCSHIVNDFVKGCGLQAICLNDSMPLVSAIANDESWDAVFSAQVATFAYRGDVVIGLSGSGNSKNVVNALCRGGLNYATTIALTGFDGGALAKEAHVNIHVPTDSMQQAEDVHMVILHMLYLGLVERIKSRAGDG